MPVNKKHDEFYTLDMNSGWEIPAGYPAGIQQKILSGALDEAEPARHPHAAAAFRAGRLYNRAVLPRVLGRGLSRLRRSDRRQR